MYQTGLKAAEDRIEALEAAVSAIDPERLMWALHRYWHTDEAWRSVDRDADLANHRRNALGIIAAYEEEVSRG